MNQATAAGTCEMVGGGWGVHPFTISWFLSLLGCFSVFDLFYFLDLKIEEL
jgi:hypothetical protein